MAIDIEEIAGIKAIKVMCSGRIPVGLIFKAFELGAEGVLGIACPPEHCHYTNGSETADRNWEIAKNILSDMGVPPARIRFEHLDNPGKLKEIINSFVENVKYLKK